MVIILPFGIVHIGVILKRIQVKLMALDILDDYPGKAFLLGELDPFRHGRVQLGDLETSPMGRVHLDNLV